MNCLYVSVFLKSMKTIIWGISMGLETEQIIAQTVLLFQFSGLHVNYSIHMQSKNSECKEFLHWFILNNEDVRLTFLYYVAMCIPSQHK